MIAVDTSVVVAAFAPWHEAHDVVRRRVVGDVSIPAHCVLESYSVLTRLPDPFRVPAEVAADYLSRQFAGRHIWPRPETVAALPALLAARTVVGGATYDAYVAATAADHGARLLTLDRRAHRTYMLLSVDHELLG